MPIHSLTFNSLREIYASIRRLREAGLVSVKKVSRHLEVTAAPELGDHLLMSVDGETYLLNDVLAARAAGETLDIYFVDKQGVEIPGAIVNPYYHEHLLHNRPLAKMIHGLQFNKSQFSCHIAKQTTLFPYTPMFPVTTSYEGLEEGYMASCANAFSKKKNQQLIFEGVIENKAVESLILGAKKTRQQLQHFLEGLTALKIHYTRYEDLKKYERRVMTHPEYAQYDKKDFDGLLWVLECQEWYVRSGVTHLGMAQYYVDKLDYSPIFRNVCIAVISMLCTQVPNVLSMCIIKHAFFDTATTDLQPSVGMKLLGMSLAVATSGLMSYGGIFLYDSLTDNFHDFAATIRGWRLNEKADMWDSLQLKWNELDDDIRLFNDYRYEFHLGPLQEKIIAREKLIQAQLDTLDTAPHSQAVKQTLYETAYGLFFGKSKSSHVASEPLKSFANKR